MSAVLYPRMELLKTLSELTKQVSDNRFVTTRPQATSDHLEDFILLRLPQQIRQPADTYQLTTGQISVFARDLNGGLENALRLEQMQEAVTALFPIRTNLFLAYRPRLLAGGSDGAGFHYLTIQFGIRIHRDFDIHSTEIN